MFRTTRSGSCLYSISTLKRTTYFSGYKDGGKTISDSKVLEGSVWGTEKHTEVSFRKHDCPTKTRVSDNERPPTGALQETHLKHVSPSQVVGVDHTPSRAPSRQCPYQVWPKVGVSHVRVLGKGQARLYVKFSTMVLKPETYSFSFSTCLTKRKRPRP